MDVIDAKILDVLKKNSRVTVSQISKEANLSIPAVSERIRKLEQSRIIKGYTIKIDRNMLDFRILAFIMIGIDKTENIEGFRQSIINCSTVLECHHLAGEYDYMLKVAAKDTQSLEQFLSHTLKKIKGVSRSNTIITLSTLKEEINIRCEDGSNDY